MIKNALTTLLLAIIALTVYAQNNKRKIVVQFLAGIDKI